MLRSEDLVLEDFHSILSEVVVKFAKEVERRKSRCIFFQMSMSNVNLVVEDDITMRLFRFNLSEKISQKFSI
jgi:hypothetical protein